jgi:hypothetical protein
LFDRNDMLFVLDFSMLPTCRCYFLRVSILNDRFLKQIHVGLQKNKTKHIPQGAKGYLLSGNQIVLQTYCIPSIITVQLCPKQNTTIEKRKKTRMAITGYFLRRAFHGRKLFLKFMEVRRNIFAIIFAL